MYVGKSIPPSKVHFEGILLRVRYCTFCILSNGSDRVIVYGAFYVPHIIRAVVHKYRAGLKSGPCVARVFCLSLPGCCLAKHVHFLASFCTEGH